MVNIVNGNILNSKANFIIHSCNCTGDLNSDIADNYDHLEKEYLKYIKHCNKNKLPILGTVQYVPNEVWALTMVDTMRNNNVIDFDTNYQYIVNMFCQNMSEDGLRTNLNAMKEAFVNIREKAEKIGATIAIPYKTGVSRGANWDNIFSIIKDVFERSNVNVEIWK